MSRWNIWAWCSLFSREGWVRGQTGLEKTWDQWRPDLPKNKLHIMLEGPTHRLLFLHQQTSECKSEKTNCGGLGTRLLQGHSLDTAEAGVVPLLWWVTGSIGLGCNSVEFVKQQHLVVVWCTSTVILWLDPTQLFCKRNTMTQRWFPTTYWKQVCSSVLKIQLLGWMLGDTRCWISQEWSTTYRSKPLLPFCTCVNSFILLLVALSLKTDCTQLKFLV